MKPPKSVQDAAKRAEGWVKAGLAGDGFTDVGRARMAQLANGSEVSEDTLKRMKAYFDRHQKDKEAPDFNNTIKPSAGRVAWDAWGGDAGYAWVKSFFKTAGRINMSKEEKSYLAPLGIFDKRWE